MFISLQILPYINKTESRLLTDVTLSESTTKNYQFVIKIQPNDRLFEVTIDDIHHIIIDRHVALLSQPENDDCLMITRPDLQKFCPCKQSVE